MRRLLITLLVFSAPMWAQLQGFSKEQLVKYTAQSTWERFPDGRPKVPDNLIEAMRAASSEMLYGPLRREGFINQWEAGWKIVHPEVKLIGRAFTAQYMPLRPDVHEIIEADAKAAGLSGSNNQRVINLLQPGDVLVVDLFGKIEQGTFAGDNLAAAIFAATGNGFVIDGSVRDLDGIHPQNIPVYVRDFHVSAIGNVMLTGINVPVQIGDVTVMPGDIVVGDREGLNFVPAHLAQPVGLASKMTELHDVWTKEKFASGKYKSTDLYPRPSDPALIKEFEDWQAMELKKLGLEPPAPRRGRGN